MSVAWVAGGIVGARNNVLTAEPLKASGEAARRMPKFYSARLQYRQLRRLECPRKCFSICFIRQYFGKNETGFAHFSAKVISDAEKALFV